MASSRDRRNLRRLLLREGLSLPQPPPPIDLAKDATPFWKKYLRWLYRLLGFAALLGALAAIYPWLSIHEGAQLEPINPYTNLFTVSNDGFIPLTDLGAVCTFGFKMTDALGREHDYSNNTMNVATFAHYLGHGDPVTLPCFSLFVGKFPVPSGATFDISVNYAFYHLNLPILRRSQDFHFVNIVGTDNIPHWKFMH